ncbi:MAG TPA: Mur ligase family protein [Woeseiaceae bacterium]|nr:Mur ligase family protein [Woeseiaceae bacterium]
MRFLEARRLTGPNLHFDLPAAVVDVACEPREADRLAPAWAASVARLWQALGEPVPDTSRLDVEGGISLAFAAPIDALYAACEVSELAFAVAAAGVNGEAPPEIDSELGRLTATREQERNAPLVELAAAAASRGLTLLWDDDEVSLGTGATVAVWPARDLPAAATVDWSRYRDVPRALVTGTNGKTTTVRLAQHILRGAGRTVGVSSTDWIAVDDRILDRGDWSGPGGARTVLRQPDVDVAILETARGGLLRRGLAVNRADAALITNIAADHLGDFGSRNLVELLCIKWLVTRAVAAGGTLILNADDEQLVARAQGYAGRVAWFGLDVDNPVVAGHRDDGGRVFAADGSRLLDCTGGEEALICHDHDIPIAFGGAARHNVANALAAAALTLTLGATLEDVRRGLTSMSQDDNPGRCNLYEVGARRVLVDFAHNPQAMRALAHMAAHMPARRRALCFGQAGDRPDELIRALTRDAWAIGLDRVYVSELAAYRRGRQAGEVYAVIRDELLALGADPACIEHHELESESLAAAMDWAGDGDLVIMLALGGAAPIQARIEALIRETE